MTEATLSPEIEEKLLSIPGTNWEDYCKNQRLDFGAWQQARLRQLRAAATVAVEQLGPELAELRQSVDSLMECGLLRDRKFDALKAERDKLWAELATLRKHEPTTIEEAQEAMRAGYKYSGFPGLAAEIDKLRERPLPMSGGGMGIEDRVKDIFAKHPEWNGWQSIIQGRMEQAVAEAWKLCREGEEEYWRSQLAIKLNEASESHTKELQEAVAAERERLREIGRADVREATAVSNKRHVDDLAEQKRLLELQITNERRQSNINIRHACEQRDEMIAKAAALRDEFDRHLKTVAQERANGQAQCEALSKRIEYELGFAREDKAKAVAAAYEEAARTVEGGRFLSDESMEAKWAGVVAKLIRKLASERAAKPQDKATAFMQRAGIPTDDLTEAHDPPEERLIGLFSSLINWSRP